MVKVGQEFKNYKELCLFLGEKIKTGNSKIKQLKRWKRNFDWNKDKQKYIITKVYDTPKSKPKSKHKGSPRFSSEAQFKHFDCYKVDKSHNKSKGVYKIQLDNFVYVGSTITDFRTRFLQHYNNHCKQMPHTQQLLLSGGTFEVLWVADETDAEEIVREKERQYIQEFKDKGFEMLNSRNPEILKKKNKKKKIKYKKIKVNELDYAKAIELLKANNINMLI